MKYTKKKKYFNKLLYIEKYLKKKIFGISREIHKFFSALRSEERRKKKIRK